MSATCNEILDHAVDGAANQDLPVCRFAAQAGSEVGHRPDCRVLEAALEPNTAQRRVAECDADTEPELVAGSPPVAGQALDPLAQEDCHADSPLSVVRWGSGSLKNTMIPSPAKYAIVPSKLRIASPSAPWYSSRTRMTSSGSAISAKPVKPRRSPNTTVIRRRWLLSIDSSPDETMSSASCGAKIAPQPSDPLQLINLLPNPGYSRVRFSSARAWLSSASPCVPFLDSLLQGRVGLAQIGGHVIELIGERLELVAAADLDGWSETPCPIRAAPAWRARIGTSIRRTSNKLARTDSIRPSSSKSAVLEMDSRTDTKAWSSGWSTKTIQPEGSTTL